MIRQTFQRNIPQRTTQIRTGTRTQTQNQTIGQRAKTQFEEQKVLNENKLRIKEATQSFAGSFNNVKTLETEAQKYFQNNVNNVDPRLRNFFQESLSQEVSKVKGNYKLNINKLKNEVDFLRQRYREIDSRPTETQKQRDKISVTLQNLDTTRREIQKLLREMERTGDLYEASKIINYAKQVGSVEAFNLNRTIKGLNIQADLRAKQQTDLAKAREEASQKLTGELQKEVTKARTPTIQELAQKEIFGKQSINIPTLETKNGVTSINDFERKQTIILSSDLNQKQKDLQLELLKRSFQKSSAIQNVDTFLQQKELEKQRATELKKQLPSVLSTYRVDKGVLNRARTFLDERIDQTAFNKARTLEQINAINNPYLKVLRKLQLSFKTTPKEALLGIGAGIVNYGTGILQIPAVIKLIASGQISMTDVGKGVFDYLQSLGMDIAYRPAFGIARAVTEIGLDILTDKAISKIVSGVAGKVTSKIEVERLAFAQVVGDNAGNLKLNLKTYKDIVKKVPKVTNQLDGVIRGKLFYTSDGLLKMRINIFDRTGRRLAQQTKLLGKSPIFQAVNKGDDVARGINNIVKTRSMDFVAQARLNLKTKTLDVIRGKATSLSATEWNAIKNIINQRVAVRSAGTREITVGKKATELKRKIMSQADQDRLRKVFDEAMRRKPDGVTPKSRQIPFQDIKIKITQDSLGRLLIDIPDNYINQFSKLELLKKYRVIKTNKGLILRGRTDLVIPKKAKLPSLTYVDDVADYIIRPESMQLLTDIKKKFNIIEVKRLQDKSLKLKLTGKKLKSDSTIFAEFIPKAGKRKKVFDVLDGANEPFKKIALKRKQLTSELQNLKRIQRKIKRNIKLLPYEKKLLLESRFKIRQTILPDGRRLIEIPDLDDIYRRELSKGIPDKYKSPERIIRETEIKKIPPKTEVYREVINADGTVLLMKLEPPQLKKIPKLKKKLQSLQVSRQEAMSKLNEKLRTKTKAKLQQQAKTKQVFMKKLEDPIIAYKVIKETKSKLGTVTGKLAQLSSLLSRSQSKAKSSLNYQALRMQQETLKKQRQVLDFQYKTARAKIKDTIIGLSKAKTRDSAVALISLRALMPVTSLEYRYVTEQLKKIPDLAIKLGSRIKTPDIKFKLSWKKKLKEKDLNYMTNGLVKVGNTIKEIKLRTTPYRAVKYMINLVDNTVARSFALKIVGLIRKKDIEKPSLKKFRLKFGKNPLVLQFVEKSRYAIDTAGEKRGLKVSKYLKQRRRK